MKQPLLYRSRNNWHIWLALLGAILLHVAAVVVAEHQPRHFQAELPPGDIVDVIVDEVAERDVTKPQPEQEELPPPAAPRIDEETFSTEYAPTPPPIRKATTHRIQPLVRHKPTVPTGAATMRAAKAMALYAPRPEYPYEARRQRITGSGVAVLSVDFATGQVTDVQMIRSTGSAVLDNATISGFRRWRFKPGTVSKVQTPVTYTLAGAGY